MENLTTGDFSSERARFANPVQRAGSRGQSTDKPCKGDIECLSEGRKSSLAGLQEPACRNECKWVKMA